MIAFARLLAVACSIVLAVPVVARAAMPADAPDARDHALISRYAGSWLVAQDVKGFDQVGIPRGSQNGEVAKIEGRVTRLFYLAPAGKSVLEVQRNYEQALERAGAARQDSCADNCGARDFGQLRKLPANPSLPKAELEGWSPITLLQQWQESGTERYWYGTVNASGTTLHVGILTARPGTFALSSKYVATIVEIVEPKAMESDKVLVDVNALTKGLQADGKVALYGLYFDTGKSVIKPESKAQVDQMAKLLQSDGSLKVHIVGHTDNQGSLEANLALSKARAQTVVDALATTYKVDPRRLSAAGVASYAPLGNNTTDVGRARNRRVEMVLQ
ncbi:OmpA family protein [Bradyrhizobium cajani]|uniref:OmpA family protein n=1 Tax=Bradyrhizobium cajani TaxID=1928661 RepID=A0A844TAT0_9BRAD|nr:OmpA family protein [Bradyrhizobium cajani]MCP3368890.1 OmpA family protein [Bradyrhizobium cajani]MVT76203.1 OmpA family protein [Bradyrhizobium cajani]